MKLQWQQRQDGFWNADCPCGSALCGTPEADRDSFEAAHLGAVARLGDHEAMLRPERAHMLAAFFACSASYWAMQREKPDVFGVTAEQMPVLEAMDVLRKALVEES